MLVRGAMHLHSSFSYDAKLSLAEMRSLFAKRGLSFACITEHGDFLEQDKADALAKACADASDENFVFVPGFEIPYDRCHVMAIGAMKLNLSLPAIEQIRECKNQGALIVLAHPHRNGFKITSELEGLLDGVEVWNSHYDGKYAPRTRSVEWLKTLIGKGLALRAYAGLDFHRVEHLGGPALSLEVGFLTVSEIVSGLKSNAYGIARGNFHMTPYAKYPGSAIWVRLKSFFSIVVVTFSKKLSKLMAGWGLRLPKGLKSWLRKWL